MISDWADNVFNFVNSWLRKISYQIRMLKHRPKLWRDKRYVPEDEFDKSLDLNGWALMDMSKEDRLKYMRDLGRRRQIAHERDMNQ